MQDMLREIRDYICENAVNESGEYAPTEREEQWMDLRDRLIANDRNTSEAA